MYNQPVIWTCGHDGYMSQGPISADHDKKSKSPYDKSAVLSAEAAYATQLSLSFFYTDYFIVGCQSCAFDLL
jgi:hypothetical protein